MSLRGSIDHFTIQQNRVMVGGWAYCAKGSDRLPVDGIELEGIDAIGIEFFSRGDFGEANKFGFRIQFDGIDNLLALVWGRSRCTISYEGNKQPIYVWKKRHDEILAAALSHKMADLEGTALHDLTSRLAGEVKRRGGPVLAGGLQEVLVETGLTAHDGTVVLGRDGYLFLRGGNNSVAQLYQMPLSDRTLAGWEALIRRRHEQCTQLGAKFVQLIIPEKQSVLTSYYPEPLVAPTPTLQTLTTRLADLPAFLDAYNVLMDVHQREGLSPFRRVDSHLSFHGARYLAQEICRLLSGSSLPISKTTLAERVVGGDLGNKFAFGNLLERLLVAALDDWDFAQAPVTLLQSHDPASGHTGTVREWSNERPLIDKAIVVFGNSMFERGDGPLGLSWWLARIFRSTVFVWRGAMDLELIKQRRPEYVVAQTVERFLTVVPAQ